jgi:hypothetical protein
MSADPSDSAFDLAPVPRKYPHPRQAQKVVPLEYRPAPPEAPPIAAVDPAAEEKNTTYKLSTSEYLLYVLRMLGCLGLIGLGALWLIFVDHRSLAGMVVGFFFIGVGFSLLFFAGPSDAEKKGYHF